MLQRGSADGQGVADVAQSDFLVAGLLPVTLTRGERGAQPLGLGPQCRPAPGRHHQGHRYRQEFAIGGGGILTPLLARRLAPLLARRLTPLLARLPSLLRARRLDLFLPQRLDLLPRRLLHQKMGVGAADPERRHTGAPRASLRRPRQGLGQQFHRTRRPVHVRGGPVHVERPRQEAMPHGHDHLDHAGDAGRRLRVPDVRLERAEPERPFPGPPLPVRRQQCLGLDRVTERRARPVRLHRVHIGRVQARRRQGLLDDPLLGGAVGRGQAVGRTVLVHGRAADHREDATAGTAGVGQPHEDQHTGALAPAGAVGRRRERLAAAVRSEPALPAEGGEDAGAADDGDTAGQGEAALTLAQGLAGEVQRHQGARTGRVHGEGRPLQAQRVGGAAGDHAGRDAGEQVAVQAVGGLVQAEAVLLGFRADEDTRAAAAQGVRIDARVFQGLPAQFQHHPLLRVHGGGLARADAEELGVEAPRALQEGGVAYVTLAGRGGVGVVEVVHVPAAVGGQRRQGVTLLGHQAPQGVGRGRAAGEAAADADDGDRFVRIDVHRGERTRPRRPRGRLVAQQPTGQEAGQRERRRMVEDHGDREVHPGGGHQLRVQFDGGQRVEPQLLERQFGLHRVHVTGGQRGHDGRSTGAYEVQNQGLTGRGRQTPQPPDQRLPVARPLATRHLVRNEIPGLAHPRTPLFRYVRNCRTAPHSTHRAAPRCTLLRKGSSRRATSALG